MILVNEKMGGGGERINKSRPLDWPFFCPAGGQETISHLRQALGGRRENTLVMGGLG